MGRLHTGDIFSGFESKLNVGANSWARRSASSFLLFFEFSASVQLVVELFNLLLSLFNLLLSLFNLLSLLLTSSFSSFCCCSRSAGRTSCLWHHTSATTAAMHDTLPCHNEQPSSKSGIQILPAIDSIDIGCLLAEMPAARRYSD